ncbi:hypothetical protein H8356DRAFT_1320867 [Neocallimastix lanati (nom. inval.)]|nr:hypothetical protein H8356DRAFT_1320867 [Neocallimastix sp. JGI-2020a]
MASYFNIACSSLHDVLDHSLNSNYWRYSQSWSINDSNNNAPDPDAMLCGMKQEEKVLPRCKIDDLSFQPIIFWLLAKVKKIHALHSYISINLFLDCEKQIDEHIFVFLLGGTLDLDELQFKTGIEEHRHYLTNTISVIKLTSNKYGKEEPLLLVHLIQIIIIVFSHNESTKIESSDNISLGFEKSFGSLREEYFNSHSIKGDEPGINMNPLYLSLIVFCMLITSAILNILTSNSKKHDGFTNFSPNYNPICICLQEINYNSIMNSFSNSYPFLNHYRIVLRREDMKIPATGGFYIGIPNSCHFTNDNLQYLYILSVNIDSFLRIIRLTHILYDFRNSLLIIRPTIVKSVNVETIRQQ